MHLNILMILIDFKSQKGIREVTEQAEAEYIITVLNMVNWNIGQAARVLKINRSTLFRKMKKYGIKKNR